MLNFLLLLLLPMGWPWHQLGF